MDNKNKGFSLIELVIVITIMVTLSAILAPQLLRYVSQARAAACTANRSEFVNYFMLYSVEAEETASIPDFLLSAKAAGLDADKICKAGGTCTFEIADGRLVALCSLHDDIPAAGPVNTSQSVNLFNPATGKYVEVNVVDYAGKRANEIGQSIIYYKDANHPAGYYYINTTAFANSGRIIDDMEAYITRITDPNYSGSSSDNNFVPLKQDVPIQVYNPSEAVKGNNKSDNAIVQKGQCYYVDFQWDDNPNPVLAIYTGDSGNLAWRGDLTADKNSTGSSNSIWWTVLDVK